MPRNELRSALLLGVIISAILAGEHDALVAKAQARYQRLHHLQ